MSNGPRAAALQVFVLRDGDLVASEMFGEGLYHLGPEADNDVRLDHAAVSPVVLEFRDGKIRLTGAGGFHLNGVRVAEAELSSADDVWIGPFLLKTRIMGRRPPPRATPPGITTVTATGKSHRSGGAALALVPEPPPPAAMQFETDEVESLLATPLVAEPAHAEPAIAVPAIAESAAEDSVEIETTLEDAAPLSFEGDAPIELDDEETALLLEELPEDELREDTLVDAVLPEPPLVDRPAGPATDKIDTAPEHAPVAAAPAPAAKAKPGAAKEKQPDFEQEHLQVELEGDLSFDLLKGPPAPAEAPDPNEAPTQIVANPFAAGRPARPAAAARPAGPIPNPFEDARPAAAELKKPATRKVAPTIEIADDDLLGEPASDRSPARQTLPLGRLQSPPALPVAPAARATSPAAPVPAPVAPQPAPVAPQPVIIDRQAAIVTPVFSPVVPPAAVRPQSVRMPAAAAAPKAPVAAVARPSSVSSSAGLRPVSSSKLPAIPMPVLDAPPGLRTGSSAGVAKIGSGLLHARFFWEDTLLYTCSTPATLQPFTKAADAAALAMYGFVPKDAPLARNVANGFQIKLPDNARAFQRSKGTWTSAQASASRELQLPNGAVVRITNDRFHLELSAQPAPEKFRTSFHGDLDYRMIALLVGVALSLIFFVHRLPKVTFIQPPAEIIRHVQMTIEKKPPEKKKEKPKPPEPPKPVPMAEITQLKQANVPLKSLDKITKATKSLNNMLASLTAIAPSTARKDLLAGLPGISRGPAPLPSLGGSGAGGPVTKGNELLRGGVNGLLASATAGHGAVNGVPVSMPKHPSHVQGQIDRDAVGRIINEKVGEMRGCYERALLRDPNIGAGKVLLEWSIDPKGQVSEVRTKTSTLRSAEVTSCLLDLVRGLQFPKPEGGMVIVSYPVLFNSVGY